MVIRTPQLDPQGLSPKHSLHRRRTALALAGLPFLSAVGMASAGEAPSTTKESVPTKRETFDSETPLGLTNDGKNLTVGELPGRVLIVCFWASWCPHCRTEIPVLERIQAAVSSERLRVILVNTEPPSDWRRVRRHLDGKLNGLLTHDSEGAVAKAFAAPQSVPHTVLVGRDARRRATLDGWSSDRVGWLVERVNQALSEPG
jgi:thiol-disulfide isomerase/thioredoxin